MLDPVSVTSPRRLAEVEEREATPRLSIAGGVTVMVVKLPVDEAQVDPPELVASAR